ncbi:MAG TPA: TMEM175 family protein [Caulobacteraceae bacterium]|jgi:uncharacterized membrane protein|nr:TMEM175 family protein [Caulobacteraceae bacterium]
MAGEPESLDTDEPLERRQRRHWFDRVIMLSDGVFAISITLLALELRGPATWTTAADIWRVLAPQLDAYALSFLVIGVYWLAHRRFFAMIHEADPPITVLNLIFLALVGLVPTVTHLVHGGGPIQPAMEVYSAFVVAIGVALAALWGYAALIADKVAPEVGRPARVFGFLLILLTPPLFLLLVSGLRNPPPGLVPLAIAGLFLVGWPMRLWILRRLDGAASRSAAQTQSPVSGPAGAGRP